MGSDSRFISFLCALSLMAAAASHSARALSTARRQAQADEFDAVVLIEGKSGQTFFKCAGVALSARVILTAGHCVDPWTMGRIRVAAQMNEYDEDSNRFVRVANEDIHLSPGYRHMARPNLEWVKNDLAVITLPQPLRGLPSSFPAIREQLPSASEILRGESVGYGGRCEEAECPRLSGRLTGRALDEAIREQDEEIRNHKFWRNFQFLEYVPGGFFVFADPLVVNGDSGGPIYLRTRSGLQLVGLTSTYMGVGAQRKLRGVSLTDQLPWIRSVVGDLL